MVSLACETVGFTLAFTEGKYPKVADSIEDYIDNLGEKAKVASHNIIGSSVVDNLITLFVTILFFIVVPKIFHFFDHVHNEFVLTLVQVLYVVFPVIAIVVIVPILIVSLSDFIKWLNDYSNDRALGTLGLLIGFTGTIGEFIQLFY